MSENLFVCYVPGMDLRQIHAENTPYVSRLYQGCPSVTMKSYPCSELLPGVLTGVYPDRHGKYQVSLREPFSFTGNSDLLDRLPDLVTTTAQCLYHLFDYRFDLPGIPRRRRRFMDMTTRFKFYQRSRTADVMTRIGEQETIFGILGMGQGKSQYRFTMEFNKLHGLLDQIASGDFKLEFLEIHSLDILQLWHTGQEQRIADAYRHMDDFLQQLHGKCAESGITLVILVDRGLERTVGTIDVKGLLKSLPVAEDEFNYFIEPPMARFWFRTSRARECVIDALLSLENGRIHSYSGLRRHHLRFDTAKYGELFFFADAGHILFPHDFYNPIGNLFLGLTDWKQRPRLKDPRQRAVHGYLPSFDSETGYMIVCDDSYVTAKERIEIIDVAPSLLSLMNVKKTASMEGTPAFEKRTARGQEEKEPFVDLKEPNIERPS